MFLKTASFLKLIKNIFQVTTLSGEIVQLVHLGNL
jgi:hypothetical protein